MAGAEGDNPNYLHPLLIPGVLQQLFGYIKFDQLASCRLVCKLWHEESLAVWRSLAKVKVTGKGSMAKFLSFVDREERVMGRFKPYDGSFNISGVKQLDPFLNRFGAQIRVLELAAISLNDVHEFRRLIFHACPNMSELSLSETVKVLGAGMETYEPTAWTEPRFGEFGNLKKLTLPSNINSFGITRMEILSHFSSIETLIVKGQGERPNNWSNSAHDQYFLTILNIRRHDPRKLQLTRIEDLDFIQPDYNETISLPVSLTRLLLEDALLPLRELAVNLDGSIADAEFSLRFPIVYQKQVTLEKLDISRLARTGYLDPMHVFEPYSSSSSKNIQELTLRSRTFSDARFLNGVPNLRKLTIYAMEDCMGNGFMMFNRSASLYHCMRGLILQQCSEVRLGFRLMISDLKKLVLFLPNVEKLTISIDNQMLKVITKNWTKLVELRVFDSSLDDEGLSGLNNHQVRLVNKKFPLRKKHPSQHISGISALKDLRRVSIANWEDAPITRSLGYASAIFGFQKLQCLQYLEIINYKVEGGVVKSMEESASSCVIKSVQANREKLVDGLRESLLANKSK